VCSCLHRIHVWALYMDGNLQVSKTFYEEGIFRGTPHASGPNIWKESSVAPIVYGLGGIPQCRHLPLVVLVPRGLTSGVDIPGQVVACLGFT
jgi:hypothetical protein